MQWLLLGVVVWGLVCCFVLILMRMAADQDRAEGRAEKQTTMIPFAEETVTGLQ
jgi:hypothetical protein